MWVSTRRMMEIHEAHAREIRNLEREYMDKSAHALAERTAEVAAERKLRDAAQNEWRSSLEDVLNRFHGQETGKNQIVAYLVAGAGILVGLMAVVASVVIAVLA